MSKIPRTVDGLFDLMLQDQILHVCNQELTTFLRQNVPKTADELCKFADQFSESRNTNALHLCQKSFRKQLSVDVKGKDNVKNGKNPQMEKPFVPISERKCYLCERKGHIAPNCPRKGKSKFSVSGAILNNAEDHEQSVINDSWVSKNDYMILTSACHSKTQQLPLSAGYVNGRPVTLLCNTGCKNIVVRKSLVLKDQFTGVHVTCVLADSTKRVVPVATIDIDSPYLTGKYNVWCMDNPVFDLIIGEVRSKEALRSKSRVGVRSCSRNKITEKRERKASSSS